jgi:hypothetical protein
MDLPSPPARPPSKTRAPDSGLKLMLAILIVFLCLAAYGQWKHFQRPETEKATILPVPQASPSVSPNDT